MPRADPGANDGRHRGLAPATRVSPEIPPPRKGDKIISKGIGDHLAAGLMTVNTGLTFG